MPFREPLLPALGLTAGVVLGHAALLDPLAALTLILATLWALLLRRHCSGWLGAALLLCGTGLGGRCSRS